MHSSVVLKIDTKSGPRTRWFAIAAGLHATVMQAAPLRPALKGARGRMKTDKKKWSPDPMITGGGISPLLTDLYEFTMAAAYWEKGKDEEATFSLYLRPQPERGYYVAAGLASIVDALEQFRFSEDDIAYLDQLGLFKSAFLTYLEKLRFEGEVWALSEGTVFFPDEPVLEVTAPLIQAQLLETCLINMIGVHTLIASKAARCVHAAKGRQLIDFALRRAQGQDAGMAAARSTFLTGFASTSNVLAGKRLGIPVAGTMAHSFIQSFADETEAMEAYAEIFSDNTILLIDTYDTVEGAKKAVQVARKMAVSGKRLIGVRLDSGDTVSLSRQVRQIFDAAGLTELKVFASGGFDEFSVADALDRGAAIDAVDLDEGKIPLAFLRGAYLAVDRVAQFQAEPLDLGRGDVNVVRAGEVVVFCRA